MSNFFFVLGIDHKKTFLISKALPSVPRIDFVIHVSSSIAPLVVSSVVHVWPRILVVGVPAADIHHITRRNVDARDKRDSQHLNGRGVVQDLIDHNTLKVAVNLRNTLHCTGASHERFTVS